MKSGNLGMLVVVVACAGALAVMFTSDRSGSSAEADNSYTRYADTAPSLMTAAAMAEANAPEEPTLPFPSPEAHSWGIESAEEDGSFGDLFGDEEDTVPDEQSLPEGWNNKALPWAVAHNSTDVASHFEAFLQEAERCFVALADLKGVTPDEFAHLDGNGRREMVDISVTAANALSELRALGTPIRSSDGEPVRRVSYDRLDEAFELHAAAFALVRRHEALYGLEAGTMERTIADVSIPPETAATEHVERPLSTEVAVSESEPEAQVAQEQEPAPN